MMGFFFHFFFSPIPRLTYSKVMARVVAVTSGTKVGSPMASC